MGFCNGISNFGGVSFFIFVFTSYSTDYYIDGERKKI